MEAERIRSNLLPGRWDAPCKRAESKERIGVSIDGGMIHIRGEGWKELRVGSVFDVQVRPTRDQGTDYGVTLAHAVRNSYVAHLGDPKIFGQFEGHATCIALELEVAAWHYPSIARALRKGAGQFRVQAYFAVTQFEFRVYIAALIVAFIATRYQRPELAALRLKALAFVNT